MNAEKNDIEFYYLDDGADSYLDMIDEIIKITEHTISISSMVCVYL